MDWLSQARMLLRWWWLIAFLCLAAGATAFFGSRMMPEQYQSEAKVLVGPLTDTVYDHIQAYQQLAQTYAEVARTTPVLTRVIDKLGLHDTAAQLAARLDVRAVTGESIVRVVATAPLPQEAAEIANSVADEIAAMGLPSIDQSSPAPSSSAEPSPTPSSSAEPSPTPSRSAEPSPTPSRSANASPAPSNSAKASPAKPSPRSSAAQSNSAEPSPTPSSSAAPSPTPSSPPPVSLAAVVQPALPAASPSSPRVLLNSAIGAALGFALGVGIALLLGNRASR